MVKRKRRIEVASKPDNKTGQKKKDRTIVNIQRMPITNAHPINHHVNGDAL